MRWKSYRITELQKELQTDTIWDTLALVDSGVVSRYDIHNDYIAPENSTMGFVGATTTKAGDIIAIIRDSVEIASGVVITVDNESHTMTFNSLLTLFDTDVINIYRQDKFMRVYEPMDEIVKQIKTAFATKTVDIRRRLPLQIISVGKAGFRAWDRETSFNLLEWLLELFDTSNIVLQASLVFEDALSYIRLKIFVNTKAQDIVKMNISSMSITHSETASPSATVCTIIEKDTLRQLQTYYLTVDGEVTVTTSHPRRFDLYKLTLVEDYQQKIEQNVLDPNTGEPIKDDNGNITTEWINNPITQPMAARNKMSYGEFSHIVKIETQKGNSLIENIEIGDRVVIVHKTFTVTGDETTDDTDDEKEKYILSSIFTGKNESSDSETITLVFGKIRVNYTEIKGR